MISRFGRWFHDPVFLLSMTACLAALLVQSGELGSADTAHRLQTTHSFWTSEPQVFPQEYPEFGLHGRGGRLYSWYGMGQSLLMLPADIVGTGLERLPVFAAYDDDPSVRSITVSFITNILVNLLTALIAFRFLGLLQFNRKEAVAGVLALLFCTTHLHYTQNMMENNYIMLLTLAGFAFQYEWLRTGNRRLLILGSAALGLNLLTRLTTGLDLMAVGIFLWLTMWFERGRGRGLWEHVLEYSRTAFPVYAAFALVDRIYQYYRFGSFFNTYLSVFAREYRRLDPSLPPNYPWETPFHVGFLGPLITPEKSVFLFDPLLVLSLVVAVVAWKCFPPEIKAYLSAAFLLLLAYMCFYAKYTVWSGDFAWGDRYISTTVEFAAFISVPLLLRYHAQIGKLTWGLGIALIVISSVIQVASLAFWLPLEIYQMERLGHPTFVIGLRFKNIVAFALNRMTPWDLASHVMTEDPWDYVHITTWNFLPFLLRRVGTAPGWVVRLVFAVWSAALALLTCTVWQLRRVLRGAEFS